MGETVMKQIFDWMRRQPLKAFQVYDGTIGIEPTEVRRLIYEAEAKWEAEDIPIIHGKAELELHDKAVRAKAIDELMERIKIHVRVVGTTYLEDIDEIAEQLKGE